MIGRLFRQSANAFLKQKGYEIVPQYRLNHLVSKQKQIIEEIVDFFFENHLRNIPKNKKRINLLLGLRGTELIEALYIIYHLNETKKLKGDVCEFGVATGATSAMLGNEIIKTKANLWLYDSFNGLSKPSKKDILINDIFGYKKMSRYYGSMKYDISNVKEELRKINFPEKRTKIIPGYIEKVAKAEANFPKKIKFAYIDFDLYNPTLLALEILSSRMVKAGTIIVDDYNFFSRGVKTAVENFLRKNKTFKKISPIKNSGNFIILQKM